MKYRCGQTLVLLLVFMFMAITVTTAAVMVILVTSQSVTSMQEGVLTSQLAESAAENALLRLLRDPLYSGETLTTTQGNATVVVTGTTPKTILSTARSGRVTRVVEVTASLVNGELKIFSWREVF